MKRKLYQKQNKFRTLIKNTQRHLNRTITTKEDLDAFKVSITVLPASLDGHHILLSPEDRTAISQATDTAQIIIVLNQYWTFVQYELLEYIVGEYGNATLKREMNAYVADMEELERERLASAKSKPSSCASLVQTQLGLKFVCLVLSTCFVSLAASNTH